MAVCEWLPHVRTCVLHMPRTATCAHVAMHVGCGAHSTQQNDHTDGCRCAGGRSANIAKASHPKQTPNEKDPKCGSVPSPRFESGQKKGSASFYCILRRLLLNTLREGREGSPSPVGRPTPLGARGWPWETPKISRLRAFSQKKISGTSRQKPHPPKKHKSPGQMENPPTDIPNIPVVRRRFEGGCSRAKCCSSSFEDASFCL